MDPVGNPNAAPPVVWPKPPVVVLAVVAVGVLAEIYWPLNAEAFTYKTETLVMGGFMIVCALAIAALSVRQFLRAETTIIPGEASSALMTKGVFQRSRNPIYLAFVVLVFGLGVTLSSPWIIIAGALLGVYLQERVIKREETYLLERFGEDYAAYRKRVRRWF